MNPRITDAINHLRSLISFMFITANLLIWLPGLILAAIVRILLPIAPVNKAMFTLVSLIYKAAVSVDTWYLTQILKISLNIEDPQECLDDLSRPGKSLIICNHQSWFDIFILQTLICRSGPILQFVIKRELLWVPVLGWVCLVLDFPRMQRKKDPNSRLLDLQVAEKASLNLSHEQGALMLFPEGTRFTPEKHLAGVSPYKHLLTPKIGGFGVILQSINEDARILDVTIGYQPTDADCWRCMSGVVNNITVKVVSTEVGEIGDAALWLNQCWRSKDAWLDHEAN
ncbi:MAG: hypothetical protein HOL98_17960 [Gammaproteobacteria bacterium]|jgi:1-acyl-sn-glycerol-3-phosphate acyltransferase|nr:hypothetical protein [Gammaproteobacteria bacterium]MBT5205352.1 hypothetical protein [Gammaproteobacteria bacterium]MBT5603390.1 hypothetical protein [Gammaproteobacteria bacterium]MBT6245511.1 hypothetical protein [Gammaproteobacteria bacterium]